MTYYAPTAITNIVSMSDVIRKGYQVVMNSDRENCFYDVDRKSKALKFPCNEDGLYVRSPSKPVDCQELSFNTEVEAFTQREVNCAKAGRNSTMI